MNLHRLFSRLAATACLLPGLALSSGATAADTRGDVSLAGTWTLVAADSSFVEQPVEGVGRF